MRWRSATIAWIGYVPRAACRGAMATVRCRSTPKACNWGCHLRRCVPSCAAQWRSCSWMPKHIATPAACICVAMQASKPTAGRANWPRCSSPPPAAQRGRCNSRPTGHGMAAAPHWARPVCKPVAAACCVWMPIGHGVAWPCKAVRCLWPCWCRICPSVTMVGRGPCVAHWRWRARSNLQAMLGEAVPHSPPTLAACAMARVRTAMWWGIAGCVLRPVSTPTISTHN